MLHRRPSTGGASGDKTGATGPVTDWHYDGTLRAALPPLDSVPLTARVAVYPGGADENWADRYEANRPGQRHRVGHPWLPLHCDDPGSGRVAWDSAQRRGSRVRAGLRRSRPVALRWPQRRAAVGSPTRSTAKPPAGRDWLRHGPRPVHPPGDGRGRAHRPDAVESPNQCRQTTHTAWVDHLAVDAWRSV